MKLSRMTKEELEMLSYTKIAELYLKENKKTATTKELFDAICDYKKLDKEKFEDKITDLFESLTTSKEFILLSDGTWDLKQNHSVKLEMDEIYDDKDEEYTSEEDEEEELDELEEEIEEDYEDSPEEEYDDEDDDLSDLTIVDEDELEE